MTRSRRGRRLTREGWAFLAVLCGVAVAAAVSGNNLLYMVVAILLAVGVVDVVVGRWNLVGLRVRRALPTELFAEREGRGRFVVQCERRWLRTRAVEVEDRGPGGARAVLDAIAPGDEVSLPAGWTFASRGGVGLGEIRVASVFPFGLVVRWKDLPAAGEVLVYARPRGGPLGLQADEGGAEGLATAGPGGLGDYAGLREYRPGDRIRAIHWPTTARVGAPIVVQRTQETRDRVVVRVADRDGEAWERELGRATGEALRAFARGCRVGLELPQQRLETRAGAAWRREILEVLARQPERS